MSAVSPRIAIVGTGMIGAVHLRAARDAGATVAGVLSSAPERSLAVAQQWKVPRGYRSIDELLDDGVDMVHICSPNASHAGYASAVMRAGINVVSEKPLASNLHDAEALYTLARSTGVVATVPFVYRYHPLVQEIRARRLRGQFGELKLIHGSYLQDWLINPDSSNWRVDAAVGGESRAFADIGSHWSDLAEFVSGERFDSVSAVTSVAHSQRPHPASTPAGGPARVDTEDVAIATFVTENGLPVNTVISQVSAGRKNRLWIEFDGSEGSAVFDQENPDRVWLGRESESVLLHRNETTASAAQAAFNRVPAGHPQGYPDAFAAFVADSYAALRGEASDALPTFADGVRAARITDAVMRAAASGGERVEIVASVGASAA